MCFQDHRSDIKNLEKQLVLGEALDWLQQVRVQTELVVQLLLALLEQERGAMINKDKLSVSGLCKIFSL